MLFLYHLSLECTCDWLSLKKDKKVKTEIQIYTSTAKRLQACQDYHSKSLFQNAQWWPTWVMMSLSILCVISGVHQVAGGWNYLWKWFRDGIFNPKRMETSGCTRPWAERLHAHHTTPSHQRPIHSTLVATLHLIKAQCSCLHGKSDRKATKFMDSVNGHNIPTHIVIVSKKMTLQSESLW